MWLILLFVLNKYKCNMSYNPCQGSTCQYQAIALYKTIEPTSSSGARDEVGLSIQTVTIVTLRGL